MNKNTAARSNLYLIANLTVHDVRQKDIVGIVTTESLFAVDLSLERIELIFYSSLFVAELYSNSSLKLLFCSFLGL